VDDWTPVPDVAPVMDELLLTDLDQIAEATHPVRSALMFRLDRPRSAAELAEEMGVPVTRLYHHLNRLERLGFIAVVATRRSGAKTERRYRTVASGFRLDPEAVRRSDPHRFAKWLAALFDVARNELVHEIEIGSIDPIELRGLSTIGITELALTDAQRAEFVQRMKELLDSYETANADATDRADDDVHRFRVFVAGYPITR
jgi:predicted ArsR family transcriptional regulator